MVHIAGKLQSDAFVVWWFVVWCCIVQSAMVLCWDIIVWCGIGMFYNERFGYSAWFGVAWCKMVQYGVVLHGEPQLGKDDGGHITTLIFKNSENNIENKYISEARRDVNDCLYHPDQVLSTGIRHTTTSSMRKE